VENRYTLWLMPPTPVRDRFADLIARLSARLGTPRFEPHLTLSGGVLAAPADARARIDALVARRPPVPVRLTEAGYTDTYFRCLFVRAQLTPELQALQHAAAEALGLEPDPAFMPHLSLVYGNLEPAQKEMILDDIGRRFDLDFLADRLGLYAPRGEPAEWRPVGEFILSGSP
jgi:2'-5' RNA ligase